jgi:hypothetical protein
MDSVIPQTRRLEVDHRLIPSVTIYVAFSARRTLVCSVYVVVMSVSKNFLLRGFLPKFNHQRVLPSVNTLRVIQLLVII